MKLLRLALIDQHVELGIGGARTALGLDVRAVVGGRVEANHQVAARHVQTLLQDARRQDQVEVAMTELAQYLLLLLKRCRVSVLELV